MNERDIYLVNINVNDEYDKMIETIENLVAINYDIKELSSNLSSKLGDVAKGTIRCFPAALSCGATIAATGKVFSLVYNPGRVLNISGFGVIQIIAVFGLGALLSTKIIESENLKKLFDRMFNGTVREKKVKPELMAILNDVREVLESNREEILLYMYDNKNDSELLTRKKIATLIKGLLSKNLESSNYKELSGLVTSFSINTVVYHYLQKISSIIKQRDERKEKEEKKENLDLINKTFGVTINKYRSTPDYPKVLSCYIGMLTQGTIASYAFTRDMNAREKASQLNYNVVIKEILDYVERAKILLSENNLLEGYAAMYPFLKIENSVLANYIERDFNLKHQILYFFLNNRYSDGILNFNFTDTDYLLDANIFPDNKKIHR